MGQSLSFNLGLPNTPEVTTEKDYVEIVRLYNAVKGLAAVLDAYTGHAQINPDEYASHPPAGTIILSGFSRIFVLASAPISTGQLVNLYNNAGVLNARPAIGATIARGFCHASAVTASYVEVYLSGNNPNFTGLIPGSTYWLSNSVAGTVQNTAPAVSGNTSQKVGFAISPTDLWFAPDLLGVLIP